jgi:hypothetical protein
MTPIPSGTPARKLLLIRAPGLTVDRAVRGDTAWNLSDLIADGSFAALSEAPDVASALDAVGKESATVVELPYRDGPSFDAELGKLREKAGDAAIAILSDHVLITQRFFPEIKPGASLTPAQVSALLAAMVRSSPGP